MKKNNKLNISKILPSWQKKQREMGCEYLFRSCSYDRPYSTVYKVHIHACNLPENLRFFILLNISFPSRKSSPFSIISLTRER